MDQATQPVATEHPTHGAEATMTSPFLGRNNGKPVLRRHGWNLLGDSLVRPMSVVVLGVAAEDSLEMSFVQHQEMVEAP